MRACALAALWLTASGCGAYFHVTANHVPPVTQSRSVTEAVYFWGLVQPNDIVPPNCPEHVPLAEVTSQQSFGAFVLEFLTLGIVNIQVIEWRCAGQPGSQDTNVLGGLLPDGGT